MHRWLAIAALLAAGCVVHTNGGPQNEPVVTLGAQSAPGYHIAQGASTAIPGGDIGYAVTANGGGGYRVVFTDTVGSPASFTGTITCDGTFDVNQTQAFGPNTAAQVTAANRIDFSGVPGANVDGIDTVSSTDPIYLTAQIDGSTVGVAIYFTGATTGTVQLSALDPVAFTSP
jgi:hypothetical protein